MLGRSSKACSHRWGSFLNPDVKHPRLEPLSDWEVAVIMQAQAQYGNRWKRELGIALHMRLLCCAQATCTIPLRVHPASGHDISCINVHAPQMLSHGLLV